MSGIQPRVVVTGNLAKSKLIEGVNILANAVKVTLGPKGSNVIIQRTYGPPHVTKDGVTVAREIFLEDPLQDTGCRLVKQAANQTADDIGDGTTTATVLAQSMIREGTKYQTAGISSINIKRGIDQAIEIAIQELDKISKPCDNDATIRAVATISANSDIIMGGIIADAMQAVGKNGAVSVESGTQVKDEMILVNGFSYDHGFYSPYFINTNKNKVVLDNPYIVILDRPILNVNDIVPLIDKIAETGRPFLIMAEQINNDALSTLVVNNAQGNITCCAVRSPDWKGEKRKHLAEDIAILTGGTVFSDENGKRPENGEITDLGQCNKVEVTKDSTIIIGGHGEQVKIDARISQISEVLENWTFGPKDFTKDQEAERISNLQGGIALIKVGGATSIEMDEKRDRFDDSIHATRAAMKEGVVAGGGVAYLRLTNVLENFKTGNIEQDAGVKVVIESLSEPLRQIAANAGDKPDVVIDKVISLDNNIGYNAADSTYGDMFETGIIDPTKVVKTALINAASVAGLLLTTGCAIYEVPDKSAEGALKPSPPSSHDLPENYNNKT
jgi:chaperonin GroEL|tara:strand:+ start:626 stop:2299 length:1674 start_codon:yes stop_codon:yes gene_type:complete